MRHGGPLPHTSPTLLLTDAFKADELRRLVRGLPAGPKGEIWERQLSKEGTSPAELAQEIVRLLRRHPGLVPDFVLGLKRERPARPELATFADLLAQAAPDPYLDPGVEDWEPGLADRLLLVARYGVVPFEGRQDVLAGLDAWAEGPGLRVRLVYGQGGMGKTRLAREWLARQRDRGEAAHFWIGEVSAESAAALAAMAPITVAVDYAEARLGLAPWLEALLGSEVRVLLLARHAGDWWTALQGQPRLAGVLDRWDAALALGPLVVPEDRPAAWGRAAARYAARLGRPSPGSVPDLTDERYNRVLYLHGSALAAVLGLDTTTDALLDALLDHEARGWARRTGLGEDGARALGRLAAGLTLRGGLQEEGQLAPILAALGWGAPPSLLTLETLFPSASGWLGGVEPDLLGEAAVRRELERRGRPRDLVERWMAGGDDRAWTQAFVGLGRLDEGRVAVAGRELDRLLAEPGRYVWAFDACLTLGERSATAPLGDRLARALAVGGSLETARGLEPRLPKKSVILGEVSAWVLGRLLGEVGGEADDAQRARLLNNRGVSLLGLGRIEEALDHTREAVKLRSRLACARPDAFEPDLAGSLHNLGVLLSNLGRREEGLDVTREALDLYRRLAHTRPGAFEPDLAMSLNNLGSDLSNLGGREEALEATHEAVELFRRLARAWPDAFEPNLAISLSNLGNRHSALGRREEALESAREAVKFGRRVARTRPDAFEPDLATILNNLGTSLSELGRREEALDATHEAVEIRRRLARARPDAFEPDLALSLNNLGSNLSDLGRREEALDVAREAVEIRRRLARARPDAFEPNLASSLHNLGIGLSDLGRKEEALDTTRAAVDIYRRLARARPNAFEPELAASLNNLGNRLFACGRGEEALDVTREALEIGRRLARTWPHAFEPNLATCLNNLGIGLSNLGRREEALDVTREAVDIRRRLAHARPDAFEPDLARSLGALGQILDAFPDPGSAAGCYAEGARILLRHVRRHPAALAALGQGLLTGYAHASHAAGQSVYDELLAAYAALGIAPQP